MCATCWKAASAEPATAFASPAQLIDATTGAHRWAERYDRELEDVFAVQDEVARTIVAILAAHVNKAEAERTLLKPPAIWQAYDYYMRAADTVTTFMSSWKAEDLYEAKRSSKNHYRSIPNTPALTLCSRTFNWSSM